jgi:hypothetical protein
VGGWSNLPNSDFSGSFPFDHITDVDAARNGVWLDSIANIIGPFSESGFLRTNCTFRGYAHATVWG